MKLDLISRYPEITPKPTPLLFVHGSFSDARVWEVNFLPYFAHQGYEAHAVSLRGHGLSEGHSHLHTWRMADYVDDLASTVQTMPRPPLLIGHSMGGMVIQKYLEDHTGIAGMALMASVPPQGLLPTNLHMAMRHPILFQQMLLFAMLGPRYGTLDMMRGLLFSKDMPLAKLQEYFDLVQAESQRVAMDMMWFNPPTAVGDGGAERCVCLAGDGAGNRPLLPHRGADSAKHGSRHDAGDELARGGGCAAGLAGAHGQRPVGEWLKPLDLSQS